jgi:acyl carrier protein
MIDTQNKIRNFVVENFLFGEDNGQLAADDSFIDGGIIDSTGVLELVSFLEETFGIQINDDEMTLANLDSVAKAAAFVTSKSGAAAA